jgi:hypothetical protein
VRLWSIHPQYLDGIGLVALWRESLLAQKVLRGETRGYRNHPQLRRFSNHRYPQRAIAHYLMGVWEEGHRRGYQFDKAKICAGGPLTTQKIPISTGQLQYELHWLCTKVQRRDPPTYQRLLAVRAIECHPSFAIVEGDIEEWEKHVITSSIKYESKSARQGRFYCNRTS